MSNVLNKIVGIKNSGTLIGGYAVLILFTVAVLCFGDKNKLMQDTVIAYGFWFLYPFVWLITSEKSKKDIQVSKKKFKRDFFAGVVMAIFLFCGTYFGWLDFIFSN